jgi:hypothetical protein
VLNSVISASTPSNGTFTWIIPATNTIVPGNDYKIKIMSVTSPAGTVNLVYDFSDANFTIAGGAGLTVITPNGGENWIIGCPNLIQWIAPNITGPVKIELFRNNVFCQIICNQSPTGMTSFTWIPPVTIIPDNTYKVKITSLTSAASFDFSDGNFSINAGTIHVVSPNGGETWQIGSTHQITWTDNICDNVRIELWKGSVLNSVISASTPSNGTFTWIIPATNTIVPGNDYKVKVMSIAPVSGTANIVYDFSDANFTINGQGGLTVITPNGGEMWHGGGTYIISWLDNMVENVRIELWKDGLFYSVISNSAIGPYFWTIPGSIPAGNNYKVKVMALTSAGKFDFSDNNFTILGNSIVPGSGSFSVLRIYPNPCSSVLHVQFQNESDTPVTIDVLNIQGDLLIQKSLPVVRQNGIIELNTSGLSDGKYLVVTRRNNEVISRNNFIRLH